MKWHDATKRLPPMYQVVLVKDPNDDFDYSICQLGADPRKVNSNPCALVFLPYSDNSGYEIPIIKGTKWAKIKLPNIKEDDSND